MLAAERSKLLAKQKLCYGCYESISAKRRACNCPKRRTCKICFEKHPTGLHGFQHKKKDGTTKYNSQHQQKSVTSNCANVFFLIDFFPLNFFFKTTRKYIIKSNNKKNNCINQLLRLPLLKYTHTQKKNTYVFLKQTHK